MFEEERSIAETIDCTAIVRNKEQGYAAITDRAEHIKTLLLEIYVPDGKRFVDDEDVGVEIDRDGEGEPDEHP
ncbi:MAG: hypothetical protein WCE44_05665 [Candidatus Velthaea sp.]